MDNVEIQEENQDMIRLIMDLFTRYKKHLSFFFFFFYELLLLVG